MPWLAEGIGRKYFHNGTTAYICIYMNELLIKQTNKNSYSEVLSFTMLKHKFLKELRANESFVET